MNDRLIRVAEKRRLSSARSSLRFWDAPRMEANVRPSKSPFGFGAAQLVQRFARARIRVHRLGMTERQIFGEAARAQVELVALVESGEGDRVLLRVVGVQLEPARLVALGVVHAEPTFRREDAAEQLQPVGSGP